MCTMTWFPKEGGYELFFNRDEQLSRRTAELPSIQHKGGIEYISPTDSDAGGTWIAVNQYGITVCLLNHYQFEQIETYKEWISRGEIVRSFALTENLAAAESSFDELDLNDYHAFRMFIIDRNGHNRLFVWDVHSARIEFNVTTPKSSSSVDSKNVKAKRKKLFRDLKLMESKNTQQFIDYHSSHLPCQSKDSVCMHRDDAKTVSLSHVSVDEHGVHFAYADGSPCEVDLAAPISIELVDLTSVSAPTKLVAVS